MASLCHAGWRGRRILTSSWSGGLLWCDVFCALQARVVCCKNVLQEQWPVALKLGSSASCHAVGIRGLVANSGGLTQIRLRM